MSVRVGQLNATENSSSRPNFRCVHAAIDGFMAALLIADHDIDVWSTPSTKSCS